MQLAPSKNILTRYLNLRSLHSHSSPPRLSDKKSSIVYGQPPALSQLQLVELIAEYHHSQMAAGISRFVVSTEVEIPVRRSALASRLRKHGMPLAYLRHSNLKCELCHWQSLFI